VPPDPDKRLEAQIAHLSAENARLEDENGALRGAISLLHRIANLVRESTEIEPTGYAVLTGVTAGVGLGMNRAMLFFSDETRDGLRGAGAVGPADREEADRVWRAIEAEAPDLETLYAAGLHQRDNPGRLDRLVRDVRVPLGGDSPIALAFGRAEPVFGEGTDDLGGLLHLQTALAAPMRGRDALRGVLYADSPFTGRRPDPVVRQIFALVADHAGRAIENAWRFERVAREARTDALTGLAHHGAMWEALAAAVASAAHLDIPFGVAMVDLDDFKKANDTLGHLAGDALLAGVAERLRAEVRSEARIYRYGGEEFAVLVEGGDLEAMAAIGERLRSAVASRPFSVGEGTTIAVTCSVGVAASAGEGLDGRALVAAADAALLRAKVRGKNRVERGRVADGDAGAPAARAG
jgi:diguanylate cyclase (GGDEF)-like protein